MSGSSNEDQAAFWSGPSGQSWVLHEAEQDHLLAAVTDLVLQEARLTSGDRVLDIGCGTGAVSFAAADLVGRSGHVLATDISPPLLARAAQRLAALPNASARVADAQVTDWPDAPFDHALSRFGVMFFADPPAAFANIARALTPGGRMTFAAWAPARDNPFWRIPQTAAVRHLQEPPRVPPGEPGPMGLSQRDVAEAHLLAAGLAEVSVEPREIVLHFDGGAAGLARLCTKIGAASRVIRLFEATAAQIAAIEAEMAARFSEYEDDGSLQLPAVVNLIRARAT